MKIKKSLGVFPILRDVNQQNLSYLWNKLLESFKGQVKKKKKNWSVELRCYLRKLNDYFSERLYSTQEKNDMSCKDFARTRLLESSNKDD